MGAARGRAAKSMGPPRPGLPYRAILKRASRATPSVQPGLGQNKASSTLRFAPNRPAQRPSWGEAIPVKAV
jgi:hypothetical protein